MCSVASVPSDSLRLYGLSPTRFSCPWAYLGKKTGVGCLFLLQGIFQTQKLNQSLLPLLHCRQMLYCWTTGEALNSTINILIYIFLNIYLIFLRIRCLELKVLCDKMYLTLTPWTIAYQAPLSMGFSSWECWSGWPFISPGESSWPKVLTWVSCIAGRFFTIWVNRKAQNWKCSVIGCN